jgi:hypothetical protein
LLTVRATNAYTIKTGQKQRLCIALYNKNGHSSATLLPNHLKITQSRRNALRRIHFFQDNSTRLTICLTRPRMILALKTSSETLFMSTPNPEIQKLLDEAKLELEQVKAEKARLFPPNKDPFGAPDRYPADYTPEEIALRNRLNAQIEMLEQQIDDLQLRLYSK